MLELDTVCVCVCVASFPECLMKPCDFVSCDHVIFIGYMSNILSLSDSPLH